MKISKFNRNVFSIFTIIIFFVHIWQGFLFLNTQILDSFFTPMINSTIIGLMSVYIYHGVKLYFFEYPKITKLMQILIYVQLFGFVLEWGRIGYPPLGYLSVVQSIGLIILGIVLIISLLRKDDQEIQIKKYIKPYIYAVLITTGLSVVLVVFYFIQNDILNGVPPILYFILYILMATPLLFLLYFFIETEKKYRQ